MEGSGITRLEHFESIAEQTGEPPPELDGPEFPGIVAHVWEWFLQLSAGRRQGAISYTEIKAWAELTGTAVTPFEIELIKELDLAFITHNQPDGR